MNQSYSTLSTTDRCLVAIPNNLWSLSVIRDGDTITAEITHFNGATEMCAVKVANHCYDVTFSIFSRIFGKLKQTKTVKFTTTKCWLEQWIEMAQVDAKVAA